VGQYNSGRATSRVERVERGERVERAFIDYSSVSTPQGVSFNREIYF
jgi:hypothetical protein